MVNHPARRRRGLTFLEILITLVMVSLVAGSIFQLMNTATRAAYRGGDESLATQYGAEIIETIRGAPFGTFKADERPLTPEMIFKEHNIPEGVDIANYDPRFSIEATVSPVEPYSPREMKKVKVVVSWISRQSKQPRNSVFVTLYTPAIK